MSASVLLYADKFVIFCHPNTTKLLIACNLLALFEHTLGLYTNFVKCLVLPITVSRGRPLRQLLAYTAGYTSAK